MAFRLGNSGRGHRGRTAATRTILGIPELDARLEGLELAVANRVARGGLAKGVRVAVKKIKAEVPSTQKHLRKAIGGYVKKQKRGTNKGIVEAKAGAAVGVRQQSIVRRGKVAGRGGVGISAANIHWYILGTSDRTVKTTGQRAGRMPANPVVQRAMATGKGPILAAVKDGVMDGIKREAAKQVALHNVK